MATIKSIEEKAKRYDEAYKKVAIRFGSNVADEIFLKESEDERIRKEMIELLRKEARDFPSSVIAEKSNSWITWLEKQGNLMKALQISNAKIGELIEKNYYLKEQLEKQGEQKPIKEHNACEFCEDRYGCVTPCSMKLIEEEKFTYKVKPKFEIGDLITNGILVGKIDEIHEFGYHAYFGDHYADVPNAEYWHKWTIQDAKDGDVLCCESGWTCIFKTLVNDETFSSYCFMDKTKWFCETGSECHTLKEEFVKAYNGKIYPATKGQRDLLFQKMKEAGYEWDAKKKELKKIEQKPTWSEEDEKRISSILLSIEYCKEQYPNLREYQYDIDWLKSLKERYTWKPSNEQMNTLEQWLKDNQYKGDARYCYPIFESLYQDLKKLKG